VSILDEILTRVRERLSEKRQATPVEEIRALAEAAPVRASLRERLDRPGTSLIAEVKHASPSRGVLRDPYDPVDLAREYEAAGARAVSVLTEPDFFGGSPDDLRAVGSACRLPILRKDFVVDPYQCWEARAWGASGALLIVAALEDSLLRDLHALLEELGVDALVEVHTEREAERATALGASLVGVNNRDLRTFTTDLRTTRRIAGALPEGTTIVSESGIFHREHVLEVEAAGAGAVLVGEALLTDKSPGRRARELIGHGEEGATS
jgi:indole-3-glycerol phosphate synthase